MDRCDERISFKTICILDVKGKKLSCLVDNISNVGALIEVAPSDRGSIKSGDVCSLKVLLLSAVNYTCKVVRIDTNQIGVSFLEN